MKSPFHTPRRLVCLLMMVFTVICACGGGVVEVVELASIGGGTGGTGISIGSIVAIGSVHVNGVRYDTGNAEIFVEGQSKGFCDQAVLAQLAVGMVIRVEGDIADAQNGTAHKVYFNDDLRGPVEAIQKLGAVPTVLTVLGKDVILQDTTATGGFDIESLQLGDWVQVSGFNDADGRIRAAFVTGSDPSAKANLKGAISGLNTTGGQFMINDRVIHYLGADLVGIDKLSENLLVEVTGTLSSDHAVITAETIEPLNPLGTTDSNNIEFAGIVSEKVSATRFLIGDVTVILDAQTEFSGGDASDIVSDAFVEVEGALVNGIVYADRIIFMDEAKVEGNIDVNNVSQSKLSLAGLADITIQYDDNTKVTGAVDATGALTDSHHVKILGHRILPSTLLAVHIIVKSSLNDTVKLIGTLDSDPGSTIVVLGQTVDLSAIPDENFESPEGVSVGYDAFLDLISTGDVLSVKGELSGATVVWQTISTD